MKHCSCVFDTDLAGHRKGYLDYLAGELSGESTRIITGKGFRNWFRLLRAGTVVLASADYYAIFAASVGFGRRLMGKRTTAIHLGAHNLHWKNGPIFGLKGTLFRLAKILGAIDNYSITPFEIEPRLRQICAGWLYDIQFCSRNPINEDLFPEAEKSLLDWIAEMESRSIQTIVQVGYLSIARGADLLASMVPSIPPDSEWAVLMAGKTEELIVPALENVPKARLKWCNHSVTEATFNTCLRKGGLIWCYFPPCYDQSSGIFCNAFLANRPVIVRKNGFLERMGRQSLGMEPLDPDPAAPIPADSIILSARNTEETLNHIRHHNAQVIKGFSARSPRPA